MIQDFVVCSATKWTSRYRNDLLNTTREAWVSDVVRAVARRFKPGVCVLFCLGGGGGEVKFDSTKTNHS
jgi:hypothetical protein